MGALIAFGLISTISSMIWTGPRVTQVIGEDTHILLLLAQKNNNDVPAVSLLVKEKPMITLAGAVIIVV